MGRPARRLDRASAVLGRAALPPVAARAPSRLGCLVAGPLMPTHLGRAHRAAWAAARAARLLGQIGRAGPLSFIKQVLISFGNKLAQSI